jgi:polyisoprenoid-binding protein YceI
MPKLPSRKRSLVLLICGGAAVAVAAFLVVYFVIFPTSSPKPFKITPSASANGTQGGAAGGAPPSGEGPPSGGYGAPPSQEGSTKEPSTTSTGPKASSAAPVAASAAAGTWKISSGSEAGYRVREKLAFLPAQSDAVGRTSSITGQATVATTGSTVKISAASFDVAVNTLKSDRSMRDEKIHQIGLESDRYPTATFSLSTPITVPATALNGKVGHTTVTGVFNIHGVSRTETVPLELSVSSTEIQAVGALTFPWSEFGMTAPSVGGFVNVTEHATMEFDLHLKRS